MVFIDFAETMMNSKKTNRNYHILTLLRACLYPLLKRLKIMHIFDLYKLQMAIFSHAYMQGNTRYVLRNIEQVKDLHHHETRKSTENTNTFEPIHSDNKHCRISSIYHGMKYLWNYDRSNIKNPLKYK